MTKSIFLDQLIWNDPQFHNYCKDTTVYSGCKTKIQSNRLDQHAGNDLHNDGRKLTVLKTYNNDN